MDTDERGLKEPLNNRGCLTNMGQQMYCLVDNELQTSMCTEGVYGTLIIQANSNSILRTG